MSTPRRCDISEMLGATLTKIDPSTDSVVFHANDERCWRMFHSQGCCETVDLEDVCGDWDDLIGAPLVQCEESNSEPEPELSEPFESYTWTFYRLATMKGSVVLRWLGQSNGYYSESVDFQQL